MPGILESALLRAELAAVYLRNAGLSPPSLLHLAASLAERVSAHSFAARLHALVLEWADQSRDRRVFTMRQSWEFAAERNHHRRGGPRVYDPLFETTIEPTGDAIRAGQRRRAPGYFEARVIHRGIRIEGFLRPGIGVREIDIRAEHAVIRRTAVTRLAGGLRVFVVYLQRDVLAQFPPTVQLSLTSDSGERLLFRGHEAAGLRLPSIFAGGLDVAGLAIDKKGFLIRTHDDASALQAGLLRTYAAAREFFEAQLGTPLFLLYGTLLGQHRAGDFIPGDDDFDVGYWSDATASTDVRSESMRFIARLVAAGFVVTLNRAGRPFRLRLAGAQPACHLDVHAVWRERQHLWIHPAASLQCTRDDFLPVSQSRMADMPVLVPARPESFLCAYYGQGWKVPDKSYSTGARDFPRWKQRFLARSCLTPAMVRTLQRAAPAGAKDGRLIATGLHPLYPLERYEAECDW